MTKLGSQKLHICPKVTKMVSIIGHRIDYNGIGGSERPLAHIQQKFTQVPPPPPLLGRSYPLNIFINLSGEGGVPALYLPVRRLLHSPIERERLIVGYSNRHKKF